MYGKADVLPLRAQETLSASAVFEETGLRGGSLILGIWVRRITAASSFGASFAKWFGFNNLTLLWSYSILFTPTSAGTFLHIARIITLSSKCIAFVLEFCYKT